jgi:SHS family lactate transporter-like MFS transporter
MLVQTAGSDRPAPAASSGRQSGERHVLTRSQQQHTVAACFLSWTLDAFDFFIMVFVLADIAKEFDTGMTAVTIAITLTLAARPLGALLFGYMADHVGRRSVLILKLTILRPLSSCPGWRLARHLHCHPGVVRRRHVWRVGRRLTMDRFGQMARPPLRLSARFAALLDRVFRGGARALHDRRIGLFVAGYLFFYVQESPDWLQGKTHAKIGTWEAISSNWQLMIYAILIMTAINFYAHGTQDLYPSAFLRVQHGFSVSTVSKIAIVYSVGAILGCILVASLSQKIGRRRAIVGSALLSILVIPVWAFSDNPV